MLGVLSLVEDDVGVELCVLRVDVVMMKDWKLIPLFTAHERLPSLCS